MSFAKIVQTSDGDDVIIMRSIHTDGDWAVYATILRPDNKVHTHQLAFNGEEGEALSEDLFNQIGTASANSVKQGMLFAVAATP